MAEVQSPLGMDDEEFLKQDLSQLEEALIAQEASEAETNQIDTSEEEQTSEEVASEDVEATPDEVEPPEETEASESTTDESEEDETEDVVTDPPIDTPEAEDETLEEDLVTESEETDATNEVEEPETTETGEVDFEAAYKRITSPFKASKRMMQVNNVDDAIEDIIYELFNPPQAQPNPWDDTVEDRIARYFAGFATEAQAIARLQVYIDNAGPQPPAPPDPRLNGLVAAFRDTSQRAMTLYLARLYSSR